MGTDSDDARRWNADRRAILARRRLLVASALAGMVATGCEKKAEPCLSIAVVPDKDAAAVDAQPDTSVEPRTCLSVPPSPKPPQNCDPPAYIDPNGVRRIKPGCG